LALEYIHKGGPIMFAILGLWVVVLAGILDSACYAIVRLGRRPGRAARKLVSAGEVKAARALLSDERLRAQRGLGRIDSVSQIATSVGLFGTVLGLAQSFFGHGTQLGLAAPEVLATGLSTALFTTIGGLIVFLVGQGFLILWSEWQAVWERDFDAILAVEDES